MYPSKTLRRTRNTQYYYYNNNNIIASSVCIYIVNIGTRGRSGERTRDGGNYSGCFCCCGIINFYIIIITCVYIHTHTHTHAGVYYNSRAQKLRRFHIIIIILNVYSSARALARADPPTGHGYIIL